MNAMQKISDAIEHDAEKSPNLMPSADFALTIQPMVDKLEEGAVQPQSLRIWIDKYAHVLTRHALTESFEEVLESLFAQKRKKAAEMLQKQQHDYAVSLSGRGNLWVAEITGEGGTYKLERRFLDKDERKYLSAYGQRRQEIEFFCKNTKIYEDSDRKFWLDGDSYESYEDAKIAQLEAQKKSEMKIAPAPVEVAPVVEVTPAPAANAVPEQAEINRRAWAIAKSLAGGSKGSKKFLSVAFKQVWAQIKGANVVQFPKVAQASQPFSAMKMAA